MNRKFKTIIATAAAAAIMSTGLAACDGDDANTEVDGVDVEQLSPEQTEQIQQEVQDQVDEAEQEVEDAQNEVEQNTP